MKKLTAMIFFFLLSAFILPLSVFFIMGMNETPKKIDLSEKLKSSEMISVFFHEENKIKSIPIEEYLCGVVSAEMPASFEYEALKAQAVAARSYAMYKVKDTDANHPDAAVCTDYAHCKAYKTVQQAKKSWGDDAEKCWLKIQSAVLETKGEVITYNGEVAMAVFHSQSGGGRTENSADVWGGDVPYLVSVESHGDETAGNFYSTQSYSFEEFKTAITTKNPLAIVNTPDDIGEIKRSEGGSVKSIVIGGQSFEGKEIRSMFNLRSSCFKIIADNSSVRFEVTGYGHGVGMSQYGANTLAKEGHSYKEILSHYYTGIQIEVV